MRSQELNEKLKMLLAFPALMFAMIAVFMPFMANLLHNYLLVYFELKEDGGNEGLKITIALFGLVGMGISVTCLCVCLSNAFPKFFESDEQKRDRKDEERERRREIQR